MAKLGRNNKLIQSFRTQSAIIEKTLTSESIDDPIIGAPVFVVKIRPRTIDAKSGRYHFL